MSQARFLCATSLVVSNGFHLSRFCAKGSMDNERVLELAYELGEEVESVTTELAVEKSFRKVYGALGSLFFLYGMFYGAWFASK